MNKYPGAHIFKALTLGLLILGTGSTMSVSAQTATRTPVVVPNIVTPTRTPTRTPIPSATRTPSRTPTITKTSYPTVTPSGTARAATTPRASQTAYPTWTPSGPTSTAIPWHTLTPLPPGEFPEPNPPALGGGGGTDINIDASVVSSLIIWLSEVTVQFWNSVGGMSGGSILTLLDGVLIFGIVLYGMKKLQRRLESGSKA